VSLCPLVPSQLAKPTLCTAERERDVSVASMENSILCSILNIRNVENIDKMKLKDNYFGLHL